MNAFGDLFIGTFITIVVVVLLLVVWKGIKKRLFPRQKVDERAQAMTELLLFQAKLQEEAGDGAQQKRVGRAKGGGADGRAGETGLRG